MKNIILVSCLLVVSTFAKAQQLQTYIQEATTNSPDIRAFVLRYNLAEEKINETNWLPDTQISAGYFVSEPETRTGAQKARFSVKQMLPWFGTIKTRENFASAMAATEYVAMVIARRKLALAVSRSYYQLYALTAKKEVLGENIALLKTYEQLALGAVEVGTASVVDVLQLQIRQNELRQQKRVLQEAYLAEQSAFNNLLNRKGSIAVDVPPELVIPVDDPIVSKDSLSLNPELLKYDKLYESVVQNELLNQKDGLPSVGFGLDYVPVSERAAMNFNDNGKDIIMPMVSVNIPILNNRYNSRSRQNALRQQEIQQEKMQRLNVLESALAKAISKRNQARIQYNTQKINLKQSRDAEDILLKNYETGTIAFNDLRNIQELQLKFQTNQIESTIMYYEQSAIINYLNN